jgi:Ni/Co efflux regulator RcnB
MRRTVLLLAALLCALIALPAAAEARDRILQTIDRLEANGTINATTADDWEADWKAARTGAKKLKGTAGGVHLAGVVANTRSLARRNALGARANIAMLTVQRNVDYFWRDRRSPPAINTRTTFEGDPIVFQLYANNGWQVQPLGNLGTINALSKRKRIAQRTRAWAEELLDLAVRRNGAIAFEHMFPWAGGGPGWVSTMPQAVAVEAYTRLGYRDEAKQMLEVLRQPPPYGVRLDEGAAGDHLLQYSQAPTMLVGNSFAQALLSLDAYVKLAPDDAAGVDTYQRALTQARADFPRYDTGTWSLYYHRPDSSEGQESDLHYHQLFEQFLGQLCDRIGGDPFCSMRDNFARYETEPVVLGTPRIRATKTTISAQVGMSKRGSVTIALYRDDVRQTSTTLLGHRGTITVQFARPKRAGTYRVDVAATSPNGLRSSATAERRLAKPKTTSRR